MFFFFAKDHSSCVQLKLVMNKGFDFVSRLMKGNDEILYKLTRIRKINTTTTSTTAATTTITSMTLMT